MTALLITPLPSRFVVGTAALDSLRRMVEPFGGDLGGQDAVGSAELLLDAEGLALAQAC